MMIDVRKGFIVNLYNENILFETVLRRVLPDIAFPNQDFSRGKVRVVLADCNYDENEGWTFDAGIAWARRHRATSKEPVMILGFDREETVLKRAEGSLINTKGIAYVRLPAGLSEIKKTIDKLRKIKHGELDSKSVVRNIEEFRREIRFLWHEIKNITFSLNASINGITAVDDKVSRCSEYSILKNLPQDLLTTRTRTLKGLIEECEDNNSLKDTKNILDNINRLLNDAIDLYDRLKKVLLRPCDDASCSEVVSLGSELTAKLSLIEPEIEKIAPKRKREGVK